MGTLLNRRRYMCGKVGVKPYLRFTALENGTFQHVKPLEYSLDEGKTWVSLPAATPTPTIQAGNDIIWRGTYATGNAKFNFSSTGEFKASGDMRSVVLGENFETLQFSNYGAYNMFRDCTKLIDASDIIFPEIPNGKQSVYARVFMGCTSLVYAPKTLPECNGSSCFSELFSGCSSMVTIPQFPTTKLTNNCFNSMFYNCAKITSTPTLPAMELVSGCYGRMFYGCSSLKTAPALPATTIVSACYQEMFYNCTSLESSPAILPAMTLQENCYRAMFYGCSNLLTTPVLPAETLAVSCYRALFQKCSKVNYIKAMFTSDPASVNDCLTNWVSQVASSGTFVKNSLSTFDTRGINGIPNNWTIETADS